MDEYILSGVNITLRFSHLVLFHLLEVEISLVTCVVKCKLILRSSGHLQILSLYLRAFTLKVPII